MFNIKKTTQEKCAPNYIVSLLALCIYNSTSLFIISLFLLYTELHTEQKGLSLGSVPFHFTAMHCVSEVEELEVEKEVCTVIYCRKEL